VEFVLLVRAEAGEVDAVVEQDGLAAELSLLRVAQRAACIEHEIGALEELLLEGADDARVALFEGRVLIGAVVDQAAAVLDRGSDVERGRHRDHHVGLLDARRRIARRTCLCTSRLLQARIRGLP
jgi:hypothetical protein